MIAKEGDHFEEQTQQKLRQGDERIEGTDRYDSDQDMKECIGTEPVECAVHRQSEEDEHKPVLHEIARRHDTTEFMRLRTVLDERVEHDDQKAAEDTEYQKFKPQQVDTGSFGNCQNCRHDTDSADRDQSGFDIFFREFGGQYGTDGDTHSSQCHDSLRDDGIVFAADLFEMDAEDRQYHLRHTEKDTQPHNTLDNDTVGCRDGEVLFQILHMQIFL